MKKTPTDCHEYHETHRVPQHQLRPGRPQKPSEIPGMSENFIRTLRDQSMRLSLLGLNNVREVVFCVYFRPFADEFTDNARRDANFISAFYRFFAEHRAVIDEKILAHSKSHRRAVRDAKKPRVSIEKIAIIRDRDEKFGEMEEREDAQESLEVFRRERGVDHGSLLARFCLDDEASFLEE